MRYHKTLLYFFLIIISLPLFSQVPKPADVYGFRPGDDYKIADYSETSEYFQKVASSSSRIMIEEIGKTSMGKPMWLMFISDSKNLKKLETYRQISEKLARAKIDPSEAEKLSVQGKAIVWIDAGMHATERAGAQMIPELVYNLVTDESAEMKNIRENVIILVCPTLNPDGQDIVANWYKKQLGTPWETTRPPVLYQKYVGHDNNRDWFMNNMTETQNITQQLYKYYPQIVHNHHQTSPSWARIFLPPFRNPVNQRIHPGVTTGVNLVGTAMANYFAMKKMPGVISGTNFSMWWNGGMRTAPYYHNMIGILTETAHSVPTPRNYPPDSIPKLVAGRSSNASEIFYPYPWKGGESHFRDAVEYMMTASMGILNLAADRKEEFLKNIYVMGRDAITASGEDYAFAYVIPQDQWDRGEAENLVNILLIGAIEVHRAASDFKVGDKSYKAGDYIVYGAQSFRPYLTDLLEKQDYPDQFRYPGGPPVPPYDLAGWTLPMQMGVQVDRIQNQFTAEAELIMGSIDRKEGVEVGSGNYGVAFSVNNNLSFKAINYFQQKGASISRMKEDAVDLTKGDFVVTGADDSDIEMIRKEWGLDVRRLGSAPPSSSMSTLEKIKVGIYKSWVANMDEGWTRWMLEQHDFDLDTLHSNDIIGKDLSKYSAIIIPDQSVTRIMHGFPEGHMPEKFTGGLGLEGSISLHNYADQGGVIIAFDRASDYIIKQFGLPIQNVIEGINTNKFFIPGSLVRINTDTSNPLAFGMQEETAASFSRSRAFKVVQKSMKGEGGFEDTERVPMPEVNVISRYAEEDILMSGWAMGEEKYLKKKIAVAEMSVGEGNVVLFGFRPQFRGQPRGTYKMIFNSILMGAQK